METIKLKPKFAEVIDNPTLSTEEKLEFILKDTIEYFNLKNRCTDTRFCYYSPETLNIQGESEGCAVGRLLTPESAQLIDKTVKPEQSGSSIGNLASVKSLNKDLTFLPFMMDNRKFFSNLQSLHDYKPNWNEEGLAKAGIEEIKRFNKKYNLNVEINGNIT